MKRITLCVLLMTLFLLLSCGSGSTNMEDSKTTFLNSLVKIGHGFQEVFGIFGNAIGDALGLTAVKSGDKRSRVGEHFKTIGDGLTTTKNKLKELSGEISNAKNANGSTIKLVEDAIKDASDVFEGLITALTKLAGATGDTVIANGTDAAAAAGGVTAAADEASVKTFIEEVKAIIDSAKKSGVKINAGDAGGQVAGGGATAPAALVGKANAAAPDANSGPKLAEEVSKADPWAMIDKIKNTNVKTGNVSGDNTNEAGALAAGTGVDNAGAATNADLAAAVV